MAFLASPEQIFLPFLQTLPEHPGTFHPEDALQGPPCMAGFRHIERQDPWTRQLAALRDLAPSRQRNLPNLIEAADNPLRNIRPGAVVTALADYDGAVLWAEAEAAVDAIEPVSVQTIITSPPYPLLRRKDYANQKDDAAHVKWLAKFFARARETLRPDGSLVLNLGTAWRRGAPVQSLYAERLILRLCDELGFHLAQRFYWHNPAKMPAPAEWVTVRRIRATPAVEQIFWLGRSEQPKGNNRSVLRPYGEQMLRRLASGGERGAVRPSGHALAPGAFSRDNGGSIPHDLIEAANTASNDSYQRICRDHGLPVHPARFPAALPEFFIRLTTEPNDLVWDPFGGSLQTAASARALNRRFVTNEKSLAYVRGGLLGRFGVDAADLDLLPL